MGTIISLTAQAVKLIRVTKPNTEFTSVTGTTVETVTGSILIPRGTVTAGSLLELTARVSKTGITGTLISRIFINDTNNLVSPNVIGSTPIMGITTVGVQIQRTIDVIDTSTANVMKLITGAFIDSTSDTQAITSLPVDWSIDQYIILTVANGSATDSSVGATLALKIFK